MHKKIMRKGMSVKKYAMFVLCGVASLNGMNNGQPVNHIGSLGIDSKDPAQKTVCVRLALEVSESPFQEDVWSEKALLLFAGNATRLRFAIGKKGIIAPLKSEEDADDDANALVEKYVMARLIDVDAQADFSWAMLYAVGQEMLERAIVKEEAEKRNGESGRSAH